MADEETCEVGSTLAPLAIQWCVEMDFRKIQNFGVIILFMMQNNNMAAA
jgi:hypothetical protein